MSRVSLTGVNEIIADTISLQEGNDIVNVSNKFLSKSEAVLTFNTKSDRLTTYTKTETDTKISNLIGGAPELLDTLYELSQAINDDDTFATTMLDELSLKATNIRVDGIRDNLQQSINNTNTNLQTNYYNIDEVDDIEDGLQSQITADVDNLSNNYYTKTEITGIKTTLNNMDESLQDQITLDVDNLSTNYYTKTEINGIKTTLNNTDTSLQNQITLDVDNLSTNYYTKTEIEGIKTTLNNTDTSLQNQITLDIDNLSTNYYTKTEITGIKTTLNNTDTSLQSQITSDVDNLSSNYYTKTDINNALILKENISDNNDKLFLKSNKTDVYLKEQTLSAEQFYDNLQSGLLTRQVVLAAGIPLNGEALLDGNTLKGVAVNAPLSLSSNDSSITISSNTYSKEEINTALLLKPDSTNITDALALKENITANDAKLLLKENITANDAKLLLKESIINNDAKLALKESISDNNNKLSFKADKSDVNASLVLKADKSNVDSLLNLKENITANDAKLVLKENITNNDAKLLLKANKIYVDDQLALKESITANDAKLILKESITANDAKLSLKESIINNDAKLLLKANKIYVDDQLALKESIINNDAKLILKENITANDAKLLLKANKIYVDDQLALKESITSNDAKLILKENITTNDAKLLLKESIINNDAKLILKENIIENDAKLLLKANKIYVDDQLALKESITANDAKLLLKENITDNDAKLLLKENITTNDAKLLLKESIINNDAKLLLKENITSNDAKLALKADKTYVDTIQTNLITSINAGALNLSTNYYNKTSIDSIKSEIDASLFTKADKSDTYTKAQVNTIQNNLATSLNNTNDYLNLLVDDLDDNYYTKTEIDTGYYNKTEIDTTISNLIDSAPTNLDTLKEIATALNNDPNMYTTIQTQLSGKQNKFLLGELPLTNSGRLFDINSSKFRGIHCSNPLTIVQTNDAYLTLDADCYSKAQTEALINVKSDNSYTDAQLLLKENIIDNDIKLALKENITTNNTKLAGKQNKFLLGELPLTNSARLFDLNSTKFRGIHCSNPLSIVETNDAYLTLDADCYSKAQIDNLISTISLTPGEDGTDGINGTNGTDGTNGTNGIDGTNGTNGTNGLKGDKGDKGDDGVDGVDGVDGTDGTNGTNGTDGTNGTNGLKGDKGDKGDTGPAGVYTSGTSSLDSQAIISGSVIKNLKPGTAITLTSDDNSIIISGRDAFTKTESDTNYYYKSFIDNTASAWSSGLASDFSHILSTGTNNLTIRSKTGTPFDIMRIYNTGIVNFTGLVMFDAEPQDITFLTNGASYTLQDAFNFKQNEITVYEPAGSTQLFSKDTVSGYMKALKAGTSISLTNDGTSVTINGPNVSGFQNTLTASAPVGSHPILNATTIKCLKQGTNISLVSDGTSVTINGPTVSGFQNTLTAGTATGAQAILNATTIKCLKPGTGMTMTSDTTSVTLNSIDAYTKTEVTNSLALKANVASPVFTGNASVGGVLSVTGSSNLTGDLSLSRSAPTGLNVSISATNTGNNGFASLYLQTQNQTSPTINETGQIFVGQNSGMFLHTRSNHPISFQTYTDQPSTTVTPSMKIISTGLRDVEINAPLRVNSFMSTTGDVDFGRDVEVSRHLRVVGDMSVFGNGPWFCAGRINSGGTGTILSSYGRVGFTLTKTTAGQITVNMIDDHFQGANYAVFASSARPFTIVENGTGVSARTSSSFQISLRNTDFTLASDTNGLTFMVV